MFTIIILLVLSQLTRHGERSQSPGVVLPSDAGSRQMSASVCLAASMADGAGVVSFRERISNTAWPSVQLPSELACRQ